MYTSTFSQDGPILEDVRTLSDAAPSHSVEISMYSIKYYGKSEDMATRKHLLHFAESLYVVPWTPGPLELEV